MSEIVLPRDFAEIDSEKEIRNFQALLEKLERRDRRLWWTAVFVSLLLTVAVISLTLPGLIGSPAQKFEFNLQQSVRALVGLVLLFNIYAIYQQLLMKRMRTQVAAQLGMLIRMKAQAQEFRKLATVDPLTGLHNRRVAEQRLAGEVARSRRYGGPLTVMMLDLDGFKQVNDLHGHAAGDALLREFAVRLNAAIRGSDVAMRIGGDEFMVLLPGTPPHEVNHLLPRLQNIQVDVRGISIPVMFSAGWTGYLPGDTPETILDRADQALYAQKRDGKPAASIPAG
jgi:diguanylate cyclase (GGDEF)-like protein